MPSGRPIKLPASVEAEIVEAYRDRSITIRDIQSMFSLSAGSLHRILERHKEPLRSPNLSHKGSKRRSSVTSEQTHTTAAPALNGNVPPNAVPAASGSVPNALKPQQAAVPSSWTSRDPATGALSNSNQRSGMAVTVDREGFVIAAQRVGEASNLPSFDVTVEVVTRQTIKVYAINLEEAIHRAKSDPSVRRVVGIMETQS
jgi:hypothetical protein